MIDYFTTNELLSLQYLVLSAGIHNSGLVSNVVKINDLYPTTEIASGYIDYGDKDLFRKSYTEELKDTKNILYRTVLRPIVKFHHNIVLISKDGVEEFYLEVMADYLRKQFGMPTIDLNQLFTEGETDVFYIDRQTVHNNTVDIARDVVRMERRDLESTIDGRIKLIRDIMNKDEKLKKLKELGIRVKKSDRDDLDRLLMEAWLEDRE